MIPYWGQGTTTFRTSINSAEMDGDAIIACNGTAYRVAIKAPNEADVHLPWPILSRRLAFPKKVAGRVGDACWDGSLLLGRLAFACE